MTDTLSYILIGVGIAILVGGVALLIKFDGQLGEWSAKRDEELRKRRGF